MATSTLVPIAEYLQTTYRPDCDYIDGEVRERNVGKWQHARLQWLLASWFDQHEAEWGCIGSTEQRMAVSSTRIRIADLEVMRTQEPPDVLAEPPMLVIELLSPDDTYSELQERATDYRHMGVETVWIIDPKTRSGRMSIGAAWTATDRLEVPGTPIYVNLPDLFARLHRQPRI